MKEPGRIFFGAAIQGATDRSLRAPVHARIIQSIRDLGFSVISEHTTGMDFDDTAKKLERALGPLPAKGKERTEFIRNQMIDFLESDIRAAVFEVSTPSLGTGIEIAHAYLRPRMGLAAIPVIAFYEKGFWPHGLSAMVAGITDEKIPGFHLIRYDGPEQIADQLRSVLPGRENPPADREISDKPSLRGRVTAKKCRFCGHHEIGLETDAREFIPLRPGMRMKTD